MWITFIIYLKYQLFFLILKYILGEDEELVKIYDTHIDTADNELFLCETTNSKVKWLNRFQLTDQEYFDYQNSLKINNNTCNTLKATACEAKCKTRGIILAVSNCGIIISFRELFGSESLTQVTALYLDTLELYQSKNI